MTAFADYALYYDLLYRDKDYEGEVEFVDGVIREHRPVPGVLLDLGCGTGRHAWSMARRGYRVTGVDRSALMVQLAEGRHAESATRQLPRPDFVVHDVCGYRSDVRADAAISLFHVFSYQTADEDVERFLATVKRHLDPNSVFLFDYWYGPAVEAIRPSRRELRVEHAGGSLHRAATPEFLPEAHRVNVDYEIRIDRGGAETATFVRERHEMRYFFDDQIEDALNRAGFERIDGGEWLKRTPPDRRSWSAWMLARPL